VADQGRECCAHHDRRRRQREHGEHEPDQRQRRRPFDARVDPAVDLVDEPERERRDEHDDHQEQLEDAVHPEWRAHPVRQAPADDRSDREAREEAREDGRDGLRGVAEDQHQLARPDDLVDQPGGPRQREDREQEGVTSHRRMMRGSTSA